MTTLRGPLTAALAATLLGAAFGAVPASAQTTATQSFWNCRASALWSSVAGADRVEPLVANGNPNTGEGRSPDYALCATADEGLGTTATQLSIPTDVLSARTANARTAVDPPTGLPVDQRVGASASVEDLKLPLASGTVILGVAAANSQAGANCVNGQPVLQGQSQLTGLTLGGTPATLDEVVSAITTGLAPLGPIVEVQVNEQLRDATSLTVRALHVKVLRDAGSAPLLEIVLAESKVTGPAGVCVRPTASGATAGTDAGSRQIKPCPPGSTLDAERGVCIIADKGPGGSDIVIGRPFQGPSGGRVISTEDARKRYPTSPCVKGSGPLYAIIGTNGKDRITGTNGPDRMLALGGSDSVSGGRGDDCIDGGSGGDSLSGSVGADKVYGMTGNDHLNGGSSNDLLDAGAGNDTINGGYGADRVSGGAGRDFINVATAGRKARVSCGSGPDKVRFNYDERGRVGRDCEVRYEFRDRPRSR